MRAAFWARQDPAKRRDSAIRNSMIPYSAFQHAGQGAAGATVWRAGHSGRASRFASFWLPVDSEAGFDFQLARQPLVIRIQESWQAGSNERKFAGRIEGDGRRRSPVTAGTS